jgi:hypothetical protein
MSNLSTIAPWVNRLVLAGATVIFTMIGIRYIADPAHAAAATGATLNTPLAVTTTRIGFGAFPLGIAVFAFTSLFSSRRVLPGVRLIAMVVAAAIVVRVVGMVADGPVPASSRLFIPEGVILVLAAAGLFLGTKTEQGAKS